MFIVADTACPFCFGKSVGLIKCLRTIIGLKLLPTSALHHQHMGEVIVSILLLQDMIAIAALLLLEGLSKGGNPVTV